MSAVVLSLPARCWARCSNWKFASKKNKHLSRWDSWGSRAAFVVTAATTAWLSDLNWMIESCKVLPQAATLTTIGISSFTAMLVDAQCGGHWSWNLLSEDVQKAPQPHDPDAVWNYRGASWKLREECHPVLQSWINIDHHIMSCSTAAVDTDALWLKVQYFHCVKSAAAGNTDWDGPLLLCGWAGWPCTCNSRLVALRLFSQQDRVAFRDFSLSLGSLSSWRSGVDGGSQKSEWCARAYCFVGCHGEAQPSKKRRGPGQCLLTLRRPQGTPEQEVVQVVHRISDPFTLQSPGQAVNNRGEELLDRMEPERRGLVAVGLTLPFNRQEVVCQKSGQERACKQRGGPS